MHILILHVSTLVIYLALDMIGITQIIRPVFERHVGDIPAEPFRALYSD